MRHTVITRPLAALAAAAVVQFPSTATACTACMGDVNSKIAPAMNAAIFLMLGFIGFMLACAAAFGFYLMKRASNSPPPHAEFVNMSDLPEGAS